MKTKLAGGTTILPQVFPYVDTRELRRHFPGLGKYGEASTRNRLPSPLYWIKPDRKILWNLHLVKDYLLHGDRPEHQRLVEAYLQTLPKAG